MANFRSTFPLSWLATLAAILLSLACVDTAPAAAYFGVEKRLRQGDGEIVRSRLYGDEFVQRYETLDGFTVVRDPLTNDWCYARSDGQVLASTGIRPGSTDPRNIGLSQHLREAPALTAATATARRAARGIRTTEPGWGYRAPSSRPASLRSGGPNNAPPTTTTVGSFQGLVLIVDFSDDIANPSLPASVFSPFLNGDSYNGYGNNGSVKQYFHDVSDGMLTFVNQVPTLYLRAPKTKATYNSTETGGRLLAQDLLDYLNGLSDSQRNSLGIDFSTLSTDGYNIVRCVSILYAGEAPNGNSQGLWPHSWTLSTPLSASGNGSGKSFYHYTVTNISENESADLSIGTFCHESGHMLCDFPDLYDTGTQYPGVGLWCLMASGNYSDNKKTPSRICAYLRYKAGWLDSSTLIDFNALGQAALGTWSASTSSVYAYAKSSASDLPVALSASTTEYFLIENRHRSGWDKGLPGSGLAIWHIDETSSNTPSRTTYKGHYECRLVAADGRQDMETGFTNQGDASDVFPYGSLDSFSPSTSPNSSWWNGSDSLLELLYISPTGTTQSFTFGNPPGPPVITVHPTSITESLRYTIRFAITATGSPTPTYQWQRSDDGVTWADITGATNAAITFVSSTDDVDDQFRCIATNSYGSAISAAASYALPTGSGGTTTPPPGADTGSTTPPPSVKNLEKDKSGCGIGSGMGAALLLALLFALRARLRRPLR